MTTRIRPPFAYYGGTDGRRTEVLWCNRPLDDTLSLDFGEAMA